MSAVFELDSPSRAICPLPQKLGSSEEAESHPFLLGTSNCLGGNKVCVIEYQEDSNNVIPLKSWTFPDEVLALNTPTQTEKSLFSAAFSFSCGIYEIVDDELKTLVSLNTPYNQILWPADKRGEECIGALEEAIFSLKLEEGRAGDSSLLFKYDDKKISCLSLDPFHSFSCLCGTNTGISFVDLRSGKEQFFYDFFRYGINPIICLDFSPATPGRFLAAGADGIIRVYDIRMHSACESSHFFAHGHTIHKCLFNPFHDKLVMSCSSDQSLRLWDLSKKVDQAPIQSINEFQDSVVNQCWSDTSPWIFAGLSYSGKVIIDNVVNEKKMSILLEEDI